MNEELKEKFKNMLHKAFKASIKPYVRYKINDMIAEEVKCMNDPTYSSHYFQEELWNAGAWQVHRMLKKALDEAKEYAIQYIEEKAPNQEKKEEALKRVETMHFETDMFNNLKICF